MRRAAESIRRVVLRALPPLLLAVATVAPLQAGEANPWSVFVEAGGAEGDDSRRIPQVGLRFARLAPNRPAPEFSVHAWGEPYLHATSDLSVTVPVALGPEALLAPRAGASIVIVSDGQYGAIMPAWNFGAGFVVAARQPLSLRADYTIRYLPQFALNDELRTMHEATVGFSWEGWGGKRRER